MGNSDAVFSNVCVSMEIDNNFCDYAIIRKDCKKAVLIVKYDNTVSILDYDTIEDNIIFLAHKVLDDTSLAYLDMMKKTIKLCVKNDQSIYFSKSHIVGTRDKRDEANPSNEVKDFISNNKHKFIQRI
jgi:hypothetical protein